MLKVGLLAPPKPGLLEVLVRVNFLLVFSFLLNQLGVVFTVMRVLLFENTMHPTSVLFIAMCMVDLGVAIGVVTLW